MNPAVFAGVFAMLIATRVQQPTNSPVTSGALMAVLVWIFVGPLWFVEIVELVRAIEQRAWADLALALGLLSITTPALFPWLVVRRLLIPLGRARLAWFVTRMSFWNWRGDVRGGAVIAAALALMHRAGKSDLACITWIERRRDEAAAPQQQATRWQTGGAAIVATGLLAAIQGDRQTACRLLASAPELVADAWPAPTIRIANEWLCAEAIERGDWRTVEFIARTSPIESPTLALLAVIAARLTGITPMPNDLLIRLRWWQAPRRRAMAPLVAAALALPRAPRPRTEPAVVTLVPLDPGSDAGPLGLALSLHAALLRLPTEQLHVRHLIQVGAAWDHALGSDALDRHLRERALVLGSRSEQALRTLIGDVEHDLAELIRAARLSITALADVEGLLGRVVRRLHGDLLDALEVTISAVAARVEAKRALPAMDEWQSFLAVREQHAEAVALAGLELRRLAFSQLHAPICSLAVWLWNDRRERALGNAIFQWLLNEAIIVDDAEAIRLQERNVACGV